MDSSTLSQFHFLRPEWFWCLIPAAIFVVLFLRRANNASSWQTAISPELLPHLLDKALTKQNKYPWFILGVMWLLTVLALAGPTWSKLPQPIHKKESALVVIFDLSISMLATDIKPSRLVKAQHKIIDTLKARKEGLTALVAYSGDAHGVIPLTDDTSTITSIVPSLEPGIMPKIGSNTEDAIDKAITMLKDGGATKGHILLVTDGVAPDAADTVTYQIMDSPYKLAILGVGTEDGSPIATPDGNFLKDGSGAIIIPQLDRSALKSLAAATNGKYIDMTLDESDVDYLLNDPLDLNDDTTRMLEREFDIWYEQGPLLLLFLLPLAAMSFRRGWMIGLMSLMLLQPQEGLALEWNDLWQRKDQQGEQALKQGDAERAAQLFKSSQWKGTANYKANKFEEAAKEFAKKDTPNAHYNRGNALAKAGKLDEALAAYDKALEKDPKFEDAEFNKELIEKLKEQQEQQQQDGDGNPSDKDKSEDSEDQNQQNSDQQNQDQQNQDQQSQDQEGEQSDSQQSQNNEETEEERQEREQQQAQQDKSEEEESEEREAQKQSEQDNEGEEDKQLAQNEPTPAEEMPSEEQQAMEQWLRRIKEDPGGLLRRKFEYEYKQRLREKQSNSFIGKDDEQEIRW